MSHSDQLLTGQLGKRCHPLNLVDMFAAALRGEVLINNKLKRPVNVGQHESVLHMF